LPGCLGNADTAQEKGGGRKQDCYGFVTEHGAAI
jgi:hypothetical protein